MTTFWIVDLTLTTASWAAWKVAGTSGRPFAGPDGACWGGLTNRSQAPPTAMTAGSRKTWSDVAAVVFVAFAVKVEISCPPGGAWPPCTTVSQGCPVTSDRLESGC